MKRKLKDMAIIFHRLLSRKPLKDIGTELDGNTYKRSLGMFDLVFVGVGGIIGAGIFVLTGKAARVNAGPAVVISYIIAGFVSTLASLCYAELASSLPVSGSAYSFTYATLGEIIAWIIGWDLMLEYLVGSATVAVGWSAYLSIVQEVINKLSGSRYVFDPRYTNAPLIWLESTDVYPWNPNETPGTSNFFVNKVHDLYTGELVTPIINVPAFVIVLACTCLLMLGIKESVTVNNVVVSIKLAVVIIVIFSGIAFVKPENYSPFIPENTGTRGHYGMSGIFVGAVSVFFAYIGFDSVTTVAQESMHPQRDLPIGIIGSLTVCTILYIAVSVILTGMVKYTEIDESAAVGAAFTNAGYLGLAFFIDIGALAGLTSVLFSCMIGQPRIFQSMAADGLLPAVFGKIHPTRGTPYVATLTTGFVCATLAALLPVDLLGNMTSIGTLFAFFLVSISVMVLRTTEPNLPRLFRIPGPNWFGGYLIPGLSASCSLALMAQSTVMSILRIFIWMAIGLLVYTSYGYRHSHLGKRMKTDPYILNCITSAIVDEALLECPEKSSKSQVEVRDVHVELI